MYHGAVERWGYCGRHGNVLIKLLFPLIGEDSYQ